MEIMEDIYVSFIVAGKILDDEQHQHLSEVNDVPPCCGRCWFYGIPNFRFTSIGWDFHWLFFAVTYDNFRRPRRHRRENQQKNLDT